MEEYNEFKYYWSNNKTIIFKLYIICKLNNNYYKIIKKHKGIFFTNCNNLLEALKEKYDKNNINKKNNVYSRFNQKIKLHDGLKSVRFGHNFNQEVKLPERLESVIFGCDFNQEIKLPEGLKSIKFGWCFNKKVKLPEGLKSIKLDYSFNKKIKLPEGLKVISIYEKFKLNLLPNNLEKINIEIYFRVNKNIYYITNKIKKICANGNIIILKNLPNSIKFIVFKSKKKKNILRKFELRIKID